MRSGRSKRVFKILTLIAVCFVIAGGAVAFRLKQTKLVENSADKASANSETPALPKPKIINEFRIGQVKIENMGENGLVYCLGTARNLSKEQRFGVKIELELHNSQGEAIGQTSDYISVLEPEAEWNFKALVTESQATSAIVLNITETQ